MMILLKAYGDCSMRGVSKCETLEEFTNAGKVVELEIKFRIEIHRWDS